MIIDAYNYLLFIHPKGPAVNTDDELLYTFNEIYQQKQRISDECTMGVHHCTSCGKPSENRDYVLPGGWITNTLAVHYLEWHRYEIPAYEMEKIQRCIRGEKPLIRWNDLDAMTVTELKEYCKQNDLKVKSTINNRKHLIEFILNNQ